MKAESNQRTLVIKELSLVLLLVCIKPSCVGHLMWAEGSRAPPSELFAIALRLMRINQHIIILLVDA